jgi:hypothetical protein
VSRRAGTDEGLRAFASAAIAGIDAQESDSDDEVEQAEIFGFAQRLGARPCAFPYSAAPMAPLARVLP